MQLSPALQEAINRRGSMQEPLLRTQYPVSNDPNLLQPRDTTTMQSFSSLGDMLAMKLANMQDPFRHPVRDAAGNPVGTISPVKQLMDSIGSGAMDLYDRASQNPFDVVPASPLVEQPVTPPGIDLNQAGLTGTPYAPLIPVERKFPGRGPEGNRPSLPDKARTGFPGRGYEVNRPGTHNRPENSPALQPNWDQQPWALRSTPTRPDGSGGVPQLKGNQPKGTPAPAGTKEGSRMVSELQTSAIPASREELTAAGVKPNMAARSLAALKNVAGFPVDLASNVVKETGGWLLDVPSLLRYGKNQEDLQHMREMRELEKRGGVAGVMTAEQNAQLGPERAISARLGNLAAEGDLQRAEIDARYREPQLLAQALQQLQQLQAQGNRLAVETQQALQARWDAEQRLLTEQAASAGRRGAGSPLDQAMMLILAKQYPEVFGSQQDALSPEDLAIAKAAGG